MLYLLDANVLIDAARDYYPLTRVPEFWEWLAHNGERERIKIPIEVYEEFDDHDDALGQWADQEAIRRALLLPDDSEQLIVDRVVTEGYAVDLTDDEIVGLGRDPFLVAHALADAANRIVVTTEVSKPARQRHNRHVPDICRTFGIRSVNTFGLVRELDFSTDWRTRAPR
jgi:hypothetical protein